MKTNSSPSAAQPLKIVVLGGSGLIGRQVVQNLRQLGHDAVSASPSTGVNALTGEGLAGALQGAQVVVDVTNSPSFEDQAVLEFFTTSGRNLLAAEIVAGVRQHVALSVVGLERVPSSGYFRAKLAQEKLIAASGVPYTIVRATQFFEFVKSIAGAAAEGQTIRLPAARMQPIAAADVAALLTDAVVGAPVRGIVEIAGPEPIGQDDLVRTYLRGTNDPRTVVTDPHAKYFGAEVDDRSLVPSGVPRLGALRFEDWLRRSSVLV